MPFGISNAPSTFIRMMTQVLKEFMKKYVIVYFNEILVYSQDKVQHLKHLTNVFRVLHDNQLFINLKKCSFVSDRVVFLGCIVSANGMQMNEEKAKAILD